MDDAKRELEGSPLRDKFKRMHKELHPSFFASDADLALIQKAPCAEVVAYLDYKAIGEHITWAEAVLYAEWLRNGKAVYIVRSNDPEIGPFTIERLIRIIDLKPEPPEIEIEHIAELPDWDAFEEWQARLRADYRSECYRRLGKERGHKS